MHTSLKSARGENQSVLKKIWDTDSKSRLFQFYQGSYPRLSQSTTHGTVRSVHYTLHSL